MPLSPGIQDFTRNLGSNWGPSVNATCEQFFDSCHASLAQDPGPSIACEKNVKYGTHERHRLDPKRPVVVYFHGGGFKIGDNMITPHLHANIGRFFAANGMVGILGTYRLLPEARFPDGIEDIATTLAWIQTHVHRYTGDRDAVFLLGHSAGGGHLAMALFSGRLQPYLTLQSHLERGTGPRGVLLMSAALAYDLTQEPRRTDMEEYYGTLDHEEIQVRSALGMFRNLPAVRRGETSLPEVFVTVAEWDFEECVRGNLKFLEAYAMRTKRLPRFEVLPGHNHVSFCLSIGLPGDEFGPRIVEWVRQCLE